MYNPGKKNRQHQVQKSERRQKENIIIKKTKKNKNKTNPQQNLNKKYRQQKIKDQHGHYPKTDGTTDSHNTL